jgi:hypothetical protein
MSTFRSASVVKFLSGLAEYVRLRANSFGRSR